MALMSQSGELDSVALMFPSRNLSWLSMAEENDASTSLSMQQKASWLMEGGAEEKVCTFGGCTIV
jgi:hypothetical protein